MKLNTLKILTLLTILLLSACATDRITLSQSAEDDYHKGERLIEDNQYARATQFLAKFTAKYPYSQFTTPAETLRIKAAYLNKEFILSETLSQRFIDAHPNHSDIDYAEFILGMSFFRQSESAYHEQVFSKKAKHTFIALNTRNPNNKHANTATEKIQILTNRIAKHEMIIGKFYYDKARYVGAINRLIIVKNKYFESDIAPESLYWLAASYVALQQKEYAQEVIQQLNQAFPDTIWQKKAGDLI